MGLRARLSTFIAVALAAAMSIGALSFWGSHQSGTAATQTFVAKDLIADILPPPMYLIEMRLVLSQAIEGSMPIRQAQAEYEGRVVYWRAHPPYGLEGKLLGAQHQEGLAFIAAAGKVLDLLASGTRGETLQAAMKAAHQSYLAHRAGVDATVKESTAFTDATITEYDNKIKTTQWMQVAGLTLTSLLLIGIGVGIRRSIWAAVGGEPQAAEIALVLQTP